MHHMGSVWEVRSHVTAAPVSMCPTLPPGPMTSEATHHQPTRALRTTPSKRQHQVSPWRNLQQNLAEPKPAIVEGILNENAMAENVRGGLRRWTNFRCTNRIPGQTEKFREKSEWHAPLVDFIEMAPKWEQIRWNYKQRTQMNNHPCIQRIEGIPTPAPLPWTNFEANTNSWMRQGNKLRIWK